MPLSVQLLAMSPSSHKTISGFIKTKGKHHFTLCEFNTPNAVIIDIDNPSGREQLDQYSNTQIQVIALSLSAPHIETESVITIQKPVTGVELIRAAEKINHLIQGLKLNSQEKNAQPLKSSSCEPDESQSYDPSACIQGMLRKAIQLSDTEKTPVVLSVQQYQFEIDAKIKQVKLSFSSKRLRTLSYFPLNDFTCSIKKDQLDSSFIQYETIQIAELSWNIALLCSRGRLASNLKDDALYQLKSWPNLTRWQMPEHAMNIASLWSKSANSISGIAEQLAIPVNSVRSFITAALDSELAIICEQSAEVLAFEKKKSHSALFKKLLHRLKRA